MKLELNIFENNQTVAEAFAKTFFSKTQNIIEEKGKATILLSGGSTPNLFFKILAEKYAEKIEWSRLLFFWGDERCVPPSDEQSNYKTVKLNLFEKINIPEENIFRIKGEGLPAQESKRYANEIKKHLPKENNLPKFDLIMLGIGEDGHTASIFPDRLDLINAKKITATTFHPKTKQQRITITGKTLTNAEEIFFLTAGSSKAIILSEIILEKGNYKNYPAYKIMELSKKNLLFTDEQAVKLL